MSYKDCFICGENNNDGLKLAFTTDPDSQSAKCTATISRKYQGVEGVVHGGILAAVLDDAMVYACKAMGFESVTAELSIRYKAPIAVDKEIGIKAVVKQKEMQLIYTEAEIAVEGKAVVTAKAKMFVTSTA